MTTINPIGLIGDYLGTIPAISAYIAQNQGKDIKINCLPEVKALNELLSTEIRELITYDAPKESNEETIILDIQRAFSYSHSKNLYMGECYYEQLGIEQGSGKAELEITEEFVPTYDYVISPFSRCLPPEQKVSQKEWQRFVQMNYDKTFCFLGTSKHDDIYFLLGDNVEPYFDKTWNQVCNAISSSKALLSVITGTSHLAYHIGAKNIIFSNQGFIWGTNPKAIAQGTVVTKQIPLITAEDIQKSINEH